LQRPLRHLTHEHTIIDTTDPVTLSLSETSCDAVLIEAAKKFNKAVEGHARCMNDRMKRLMEDFWHLGETLRYLYKRHNPTKTWMKCLKEIGINPTTAGHAKKFFERTDFENLHLWRSKTEALHDLGILAPPAEKSPAISVPEAAAFVSAGPIAGPKGTQSPEDQVGVLLGKTGERSNRPVTAEALVTVVSTESPAPAREEILIKLVRALEEFGPAEADMLGLLDRAADLIEGLRASARKGVAA